MKRTLFVKIFIAVALLCSMGWGYTVTIAASNTTGGSVSPSGARTVDAGKTITVTATANPGRVFTGWGVATGCSAANKSSETTTITVNGDCKVTANFSLAYTLTVKATEGGSTSISSHTVVYLGSWPIEAVPSEGYRFDKWTVTSEGEKCSIENPTSLSTRAIKVTGDCTVQANFVRQYSVVFEISGNGSGTISPVGSQKIDAGSKIDVSVNVNSNSIFFKWYSDNSGCKIGDPNSVSTDVTINGSCKVWVTLGLKHIGTVVAGVGGTVSPSIVVGSAYTPYQEIKAVPNPGYQFLLWEQVSGVYCPIKDSEKAIAGLGLPSGDCTVRAVFEKLPELVVETDGFGKVTPPGVTYPSVGTNVRITATPNSGYRFNKWTTTNKTNCLIANESSASTTVKFNGDCTVSASFVKTAEVYVGVDPTYSRFEAVVSSYTVDVGRTTNIPSPKVDGYEFYRWYFHSGSEVCEIKDLFASTALLTVNESCNIIAEMRKPVSLSVSATSGGTVHPAEIRKAYSTYPENIEATPKAGYVFDGWIASSGCTVADVKSMKTTVKPGAVAECSVVARFSKEISVKFVNGANGVLRNKDSVVKAGSKITLDFRADKNYQLSHFAYLYGAENCPVEHNDLASEVTVNEDCALQPIYVPYFELTEMEQNYRSYTNGLGGSVNIRYHVAAEDTSWYYIEMSSNLDRTFYLRDYGSDEWTNGPYRECLVAANRTGCYFKSIQNDMYLTASSAIGISTPMGIKYTKVPSSYIDIEYDLAGKRVQFPAISVGLGMDTLITADVAHGYVFKSWEKLNEGCDVDDLEKMKVRVTAGQTRCKLRAVYDEDPTANIGLGLVNVYYSNKLNCMYLSLADSNKREKYSSIIPLQVSFTSVSDFVFVIDQDTIHLHSVGDTIKLPIANKSYRDYNKIDTMVVVVPEPSDPYNRGVFTCIDLPDGIMNGDEHFYGLYTNYGGRPYSYEISTREPLYHDPDALDTITIATVTSATEFSDKPVVRATKNVAIEVRTQDFSDDTWDIDYLLIDIPANILEWLDVAVSCTASGDREIVKVNHVEGGVYRSAPVLKNEGKATKGDGVLTCAAYDRIVTEFVDPFYKTVTRDTVAFGDVVPVDYQFLNEDLYRDIDSVEATEVNFAFRLNRVSPTLDKADTVMVVLFTDAGDSVWVSAVETDVYSSEFEGFGSFRFVTRKEDARDDQLDAAMDLAADLNRVVIRMQVENDGSALNARDSLVVFYEFIPADSAEIHDKDRDGRADFIRVHFAKSISNESLKIDSLFWGPKDASGKNAPASGRGAARSIAAENLVVSADGKWIETALEEPFEYGVTSAAGQGYLRISRKTSSMSQKVVLTDKVGAVPVSAVKRPGRLTDDEFLNGKTELPLDTLVVTMSEPLDTMSRLQCRNLMKAASGADKSCEPQEMFFYAGKGLDARTVYKERYSRDKSGRVWTIVLPRNVNVRVGDVISSNWRAYIEDAAGNAMGDGGVVVTGEDSDLYIYSIKAFPEVVGSGKAPRWFNPEKGESERMEGASIRVETRMAYDAAVSVFDNMGHVVSQFKHSFGKHGEKEKPAYKVSENATYESFIRWNTKSLEKRLVGTGVYIWKIKFKFEDGHTEWRTIKSGVRR